jgi:hypothetical protein
MSSKKMRMCGKDIATEWTKVLFDPCRLVRQVKLVLG